MPRIYMWGGGEPLPYTFHAGPLLTSHVDESHYVPDSMSPLNDHVPQSFVFPFLSSVAMSGYLNPKCNVKVYFLFNASSETGMSKDGTSLYFKR